MKRGDIEFVGDFVIMNDKKRGRSRIDKKFTSRENGTTVENNSCSDRERSKKRTEFHAVTGSFSPFSSLSAYDYLHFSLNEPLFCGILDSR